MRGSAPPGAHDADRPSREPAPEPASPRPRPSLRRKLLRALGALCLAFLLLAGYGVYAASQMVSREPLPFQPFRYAPFERMALTGKLELNELSSRLLTGDPVEVTLDERELNALLFGEASSSRGEKGRVAIEGDRLRVELSLPRDDGTWVNVEALLALSFGPQSEHLELFEGQIGAYTLGPLSRPIAERVLRSVLAEDRRRERTRWRDVKALTVEDGAVRLIYRPAK